MALSTDTFNIDNRFVKVIFQNGKDVIAFELNEFQDDLRVLAYESLFNGIQNVFNTSTGSLGIPLNPGSNDDGWKLVGTGASNAVTVLDGWLLCDGIPLIFDGIATPTTGPTFTTSGTNATWCVYIAVTQAVVADPNEVPALGETTLRAQIQATWGISTTGVGGVPSNTATPIWGGGVHYFPIALVVRRAGDPAINSGDVTDLRFLLPPTVIAAVTRQANGTVVALDTALIETPMNGNLPKAHIMQIDLDPDGAASGGGAHTRKLQIYAGNFTGSGQKLLEVNDITIAGTPEGASVGQALRPDKVVDVWTGTAMFLDGNMQVGAHEGEPVLPLSSPAASNNGDTFVRIGEIGPSGTTALQYYSIIRKINGRAEITCGDGATTFGDFNGVGALHDAIAFIIANDLDIPMRIVVKPGEYSCGFTQAFGTAGINLEIVGLGFPGSTVVTIGGESNIPWLTGDNIFYFKTVNIDWQAAAEDVCDIVSITTPQTTTISNVIVEDCFFRQVGFTLVNTTNAAFTRCTFAPNGPNSIRSWLLFQYMTASSIAHVYGTVVFEQCIMTAPNYSIISSHVSYSQVQVLAGPSTGTGFDGQSILDGFIFRDCKMTQGGGNIFSGNLTNNPGVIDFNNFTYNPPTTSPLPLIPKGLDVQKVLFDNCRVVASQVNNGSSISTPILLFLRDATTNTGFTYLRSVEIAGGDWRVLSPLGSYSALGKTEFMAMGAPPFVVAVSTGEVNIHDVNGIGLPDDVQDSGFPSFNIEDTEPVGLSPLTSDSGWWFNRQQTSSWTSGRDGAFACLCGAPLKVTRLRMKSMRQGTSQGDLLMVGAQTRATSGDALIATDIGWDYFVISSGTPTLPPYRVKIKDWGASGSYVIDGIRMAGVGSTDVYDWVDPTNHAQGFITVSHSSGGPGNRTIIRNCEISGFLVGGSPTTSGAPALLFDPTYSMVFVSIERCTFGSTYNGIQYAPIGTSHGMTAVNIEGCDIISCGDAGVAFLLNGGSGTGLPSLVNFIGNNIASNGSYGIVMEFTCNAVNAASISLTGNAVTGNLGSGSAHIDIYLSNASGSYNEIPVAAFGNTTIHCQMVTSSALVRAPGFETSLTGSTRVYTNGNQMLFNQGLLVI